MMHQAYELYPQEPGTHRKAFIDGAKWAHSMFATEKEKAYE